LTPYVRQESICDPRLHRNEVTTQNKREYKAKLAQTIYQTYPVYFGYNKRTGTPKKKIDSKSDLYVYFYLNGMSLLNDKGSFCFITSNSWLDVGYGKNLQEFLLKHSHVKMVIDNQAKRSFSSADINTVIVLFSAPHEGKKTGLEKTARFVMFRVPFEHILSPVVFEEMEETFRRKSYKEYRIHAINQKQLFEDGCEMPEDKEKVSGPLIKVAKYIGNKWGGKYLRAPDIYWTILEKGKGKFVRLGDIATVRRGFTTGANEFFYLDEEKIKEWRIEEEFLKPVIKSPRECKSIIINPHDLKYKVFMCHKSKKELIGTNALKYIEWGEKQGFHKNPTCSSRLKWWVINENRNVDIIIPRTFNDRYISYIGKVNHSDRFYGLKSGRFNELNLYFNSFLYMLFSESLAKRNLGLGALDLNIYEFLKIPILDLKKTDIINLEILNQASINSIFDEININPKMSIRDQIPKPTQIRKNLDDIIFNFLEFTEEEKKEIYLAVCELVKNRLEKAKNI